MAAPAGALEAGEVAARGDGVEAGIGEHGEIGLRQHLLGGGRRRVHGARADPVALDALDRQLQQWRQAIDQHFQGEPPPVVTVRFNNTALVWVYGDNAMPQYALEQLGLQNALPQPTTQWGVTQKKVVELAAVEDGVVLYFEPFEQKEQLFATPLWQAMPFVRHERIAALPPVWSYGGPLSIATMAEAITEQLLAIESQ